MVQAASKIGWIGTGVMGKPLAQHIINNGYQLMVNDMKVSNTANLVKSGA